LRLRATHGVLRNVRFPVFAGWLSRLHGPTGKTRGVRWVGGRRLRRELGKTGEVTLSHSPGGGAGAPAGFSLRLLFGFPTTCIISARPAPNQPTLAGSFRSSAPSSFSSRAVWSGRRRSRVLGSPISANSATRIVPFPVFVAFDRGGSSTTR